MKLKELPSYWELMHSSMLEHSKGLATLSSSPLNSDHQEPQVAPYVTTFDRTLTLMI